MDFVWHTNFTPLHEGHSKSFRTNNEFFYNSTIIFEDFKMQSEWRQIAA